MDQPIIQRTGSNDETFKQRTILFYTDGKLYADIISKKVFQNLTINE